MQFNESYLSFQIENTISLTFSNSSISKSSNMTVSNKVTITADILLFDLDGTLVDSTGSVEKTWVDYHHKFKFPLEGLFEKTHGIRTIDTFKSYFPEIIHHHDGDVNAAADAFEAHIATVNGHLALPIKGSQQLIESINDDTKWAICTSGTPTMAHTWFSKVLPFNEPKTFITAHDVTLGKPHPEPYLKGAEHVAKLQGWSDYKDKRIIVFEDAPGGVKAGKSAGAIVVGILSSFDDDKILKDAGADYVVKDLDQVKVVKNDENGIVLEISN